jgi:ABC-2 type transport system permease protein
VDKIKTIVAKEWAEVFRNRLVLLSVAFLPIFFVALPIAVLYFMNQAGPSSMDEEEMLPSMERLCRGLADFDCFQIWMVDMFTLLFMILPVMIPVTIAAYSIVGEKTTRSLEPLLATPITTSELILGKTVAAVLPAVLVTFAGYVVFGLGIYLVAPPAVALRVVDPLWLIAVFLVGPLLALLAVGAAIMVSSRVNDPRVAEQLAGVVVLPIVVFLMGQAMGWLLLSPTLILVVAAVLVVLDAVILTLSVRALQRETILTRWK